MKLPKFVIGSAFLLCLIFVAAPVLAAEVIGPTQDSPNVSLGAQEHHKNLYVAGATVIVDSDTDGDLVAAGGTVNIAGAVGQEALVAGGNINISEPIGSQARVAGGDIIISAPIAGDLAVAGGNVTITDKASVAGDLLVAGGNVEVDAPVLGDVRVIGGSVTINNKFSGNVTVRASKELTFGSNADVGGTVRYSGPQAAVVSSGAKVGQIQYTQTAVPGYRKDLAGLLTLAFLVKLLAWLIAAFVVLKFRKNFLILLTEEFRKKPWQNLGLGLLAFIVIPIVTIFLFITFVGYYLGLLLGAAYLLLLVAGNLLSSMVFGYVLLAKLNKPGELPVDWQAILIGVVIWSVLPFIPILGWLIMLVVFMMVLGAGIKRLKSAGN